MVTKVSTFIHCGAKIADQRVVVELAAGSSTCTTTAIVNSAISSDVMRCASQSRRP